MPNGRGKVRFGTGDFIIVRWFKWGHCCFEPFGAFIIIHHVGCRRPFKAGAMGWPPPGRQFFGDRFF